jgi:surfactin synthase thioesterase subunit
MRPAPSPPDRAVGRVVVLAHAGGGPRALRPVVDFLPGDLEVAEVTLPGRERRQDEPAPPRPRH